MADQTERAGQTLTRWLKEANLTPAEFARQIKKSPTYVHYLMTDKSPSSKSGPIQPRRAIVEKIAEVLNKSPEVVSEVFLGVGRREVAPEGEGEKLLRYFYELPYECQLDVLALTEALWRRRRGEGRAEKMKALNSPPVLPTEAKKDRSAA